MPRPPEEERVRKLVGDYLHAAEAAPPASSIPVNPFAVSRRTLVHPNTLARYGLIAVIHETAARISARTETMTRVERTAVADRLAAERAKIMELEDANRLLVGRIALRKLMLSDSLSIRRSCGACNAASPGYSLHTATC